MHCDGTAAPTTFRLCGPELNTVSATRKKIGPWDIAAGIDGLTMLKTTKSAFTGYIKDRLTTLKPATDRIFGTSATVTWTYASGEPDYGNVRFRILGSLLRTFAAHDSMSVQHTLFDMGKAALDAAPPVGGPKPIRPGQSQSHFRAHR
jgi:urate oxidase